MSTDAEANPPDGLEDRLAHFRTRDDKIIAAAVSGELLTTIAERHNLTRERVRQIASNGGYSRREYLQDRDSKVCKALATDTAIGQVAMDFDLSATKIRSIARMHGLALKAPGGLALRSLQTIARLLKGDSYEDIAADAHVTVRFIQERAAHCRVAGIPIPFSDYYKIGRIKTSSLQIIGRLFNGESISAIATSVNTTKINIYHLASRARKAGIPIPYRDKTKKKDAANEYGRQDSDR